MESVILYRGILHFILQYVDTELIRNFLLAGVAVFIVVLLLVVDLRCSIFVLSCVVFTTVSNGC